MLVSGLPEKNSAHCRNIALAALDMLQTARDISADTQAVKVRVHTTSELTSRYAFTRPQRRRPGRQGTCYRADADVCH